VNTAEVAVAVVSAGSLVASLGSAGLDWEVVAAMIGGGIVAAPIAAWFVRFVPARTLGLAVAALLLVTNLRELADALELGAWRWAAFASAGLLVVAAALRPRLARTREPVPEQR
jgi:hypothetical protein